MRLAFVDLLFSWPPHGGADVDLYHTITGLRDLGHDVHLFVTAHAQSWERGKLDPARLPFAATRLDFSTVGFNRRRVPAQLRAAVDAWRPDVVVLCDGYFLKPYVAEVLAHYPLIARYYAYEFACPRDLLLFRDGAPCPDSYLRTPDRCRRCTLDHLKPDIKRWGLLAWTHEYLVAHAFMPRYYTRLREGLCCFDAIVVYNDVQKALLDGLNENIVVVPGGVDASEFDPTAPFAFRHSERSEESRLPKDRAVILMTGRAEDPAKGLQTLREAGERLAQGRDDFVIHVTQPPGPQEPDWFRSVGWHERDGIKRLYQQADICVVPSIWEEPFGMVAVEAMASARPVCASRVGGLQRIVRHDQTGFLCGPGDSAELARRLAQLLDDPDLRRRMGEAARQIVEREYDWPRVIERHWPALLEKVVS